MSFPLFAANKNILKFIEAYAGIGTGKSVGIGK